MINLEESIRKHNQNVRRLAELGRPHDPPEHKKIRFTVAETEWESAALLGDPKFYFAYVNCISSSKLIRAVRRLCFEISYANH